MAGEHRPEEKICGTQIQLEQFKLVAVQYLTPELLFHFGEPSSVAFSQHVYFRCDELVMRVVQKVWGREVERQEHKWPADWWQAFKERWFPAWAKKRWPVQYETCVLVAKELYPKAAFPQRGPRLVIDKYLE